MQGVRRLLVEGVARGSGGWWWRDMRPVLNKLTNSTATSGKNKIARFVSCRHCSVTPKGSFGRLPQDLGTTTASRLHVGPARLQQLKTAATKILDVTMNHDSGMLEVNWIAGEKDVFPYVWLRDNCRCEQCFHAGSNSRLHLIQDLNVNIRPVSSQVLSEGNQVQVKWTDGHAGTYDASWLHPRAFNDTQHQARAQQIRLTRKYWGAESFDSLPRMAFQELVEDDNALLLWLQQLEVYGFVKVVDAPVQPGQVRRLAERISFIKKTHYGDDFTVKVKPDPSNVAYLGGPLQLHADLPYYEYKPGVQFIHCLVQYAGKGGDSLITDGAHVAQELRRLHPHKYHTLSNTPVDWFDVGTDELGEFYKILQLPIICTDGEGEIRRINFSQAQRDSHFSVPVEQVIPWYDAKTTFHHLLSHPDYCLQFKMAPGTILTFDNLRIVHGRISYQSGPGERHIEGCYVDWDETRSRRRVLEAKLGSSPNTASTV